jgi:hypothetical protein
MPDEYYFLDTKVAPAIVGARATARCLAELADSALAYVRADGTDERQEVLPEDPQARRGVLDELFNWLETTWSDVIKNLQYGNEEQDDRCCLVLYRRGVPILDAHDGLPGILELTTSEFEWLTSCWKAMGLPSDLYYPAEQGHLVVEPVYRFGGTVLASQ